mmetsp:Transcript_43850/g.126685  ORF Transcript_43850/g.126685 Transcript_43850/m.126685 type:complete len:226 (+) Transcript_43850:421-1098(+)
MDRVDSVAPAWSKQPRAAPRIRAALNLASASAARRSKSAVAARNCCNSPSWLAAVCREALRSSAMADWAFDSSASRVAKAASSTRFSSAKAPNFERILACKGAAAPPSAAAPSPPPVGDACEGGAPCGDATGDAIDGTPSACGSPPGAAPSSSQVWTPRLCRGMPPGCRGSHDGALCPKTSWESASQVRQALHNLKLAMVPAKFRKPAPLPNASRIHLSPRGALA